MFGRLYHIELRLNSGVDISIFPKQSLLPLPLLPIPLNLLLLSLLLEPEPLYLFLTLIPLPLLPLLPLQLALFHPLNQLVHDFFDFFGE